MKRKNRLSRLINKWIMKSDLPDDIDGGSSRVLLLGVKKVPSTPDAPRRSNRPPSVALKTTPNLINDDDPLKTFFLSQKIADINTQNRPSSGYNLDQMVVTPQKKTNSKKMERSIDSSIGSCSLDFDGSVHFTEESDKKSNAAIKSVQLSSTCSTHHLPSYLSLACTVNGYSPSTNYDPERLSKSRDASPHRLNNNANNIDSHKREEMSHRQLFSTCSPSSLTDHHRYSKCTDDNNSKENKSFIEQRVERLYGPGALAHGFFVSKRLQNRSINMEEVTNDTSILKRNVVDRQAVDETDDNSSVVLPVMRHLRPEFRAQLPVVVVSKKNADVSNKQKDEFSSLDESIEMNGHEKKIDKKVANGIDDLEQLKVKEIVKDGHYFLKLLDKETERLLKLAERIEIELESNISLSEEVKGKLRSASGKARLLTSQKMQQFRGLCTNNIKRRDDEAFPTTNEDLEGFWDMLLLQVDQVNNIFAEIDELRANDWEEKEPREIEIKKQNGCSNGVDKLTKKSPKKVTTTANQEAARKQRDAFRKQMIEAKRKALKEEMTKNNDNVEIFTNATSS